MGSDPHEPGRRIGREREGVRSLFVDYWKKPRGATRSISETADQMLRARRPESPMPWARSSRTRERARTRDTRFASSSKGSGPGSAGCTRNAPTCRSGRTGRRRGDRRRSGRRSSRSGSLRSRAASRRRPCTRRRRPCRGPRLSRGARPRSGCPGGARAAGSPRRNPGNRGDGTSDRSRVELPRSYWTFIRKGYGLSGFPSHHLFSAPSSKIAKCRCGVSLGALPVVPTLPTGSPARR